LILNVSQRRHAFICAQMRHFSVICYHICDMILFKIIKTRGYKNHKRVCWCSKLIHFFYTNKPINKNMEL
jgi:hypothetical protein